MFFLGCSDKTVFLNNSIHFFFVLSSFEKGRIQDSRGEVTLPKLENSDLHSLKTLLFSEEEAKRLVELSSNEESLDKGKLAYKEFANWCNTHNNYNNLLKAYQDKYQSTYSPKYDYADKKMIAAYHGESDTNLKQYLEYSTLKRKEAGLRALFSLSKKRTLFPLSVSHDMTYQDFKTQVNTLAEKYNCDEREIRMAFDQSQIKQQQLDTYLAL